METTTIRTAGEIAKDNDLFRSTMILSPRHRIVVTSGVAAVRERDGAAFDELMTKVREFDKFREGNDPYGEHDFGAVMVCGVGYFWKIDYYAPDWEHGLDPKDGTTCLLLTIMRADEY